MIDWVIRCGFLFVAGVAAEMIIEQRHKLTTNAAEYVDDMPPVPTDKAELTELDS